MPSSHPPLHIFNDCERNEPITSGRQGTLDACLELQMIETVQLFLAVNSHHASPTGSQDN